MSQLVSDAATENANYFLNNATGSAGSALCYGFQQLAVQCREVTPLLERIQQEAPKFDLDKDTPGNGYRSFIVIFQALFKGCLSLCELVKKQRGLMVFNLTKYTYIQDVNSWNEMLVSLTAILKHLNTLLDWNERDGTQCLFPTTSFESQELLENGKLIQTKSFYGRHAAFQYSFSIQMVMKLFLVMTASYSDYYFNTSSRLWRVTRGFFKGMQFSLNAEHRAKSIVYASEYATVDFCKSFWSIIETDLLKKVPDRMCPPIQVNQLFLIPAEPFQIDSVDGLPVDILVPIAHGPSCPVQVRLLSAKSRPGMAGQNVLTETTVSDSLLIHCHGGGFVAHSSQAHETYLRHWAAIVDVPILSIDYSLAPQFPFPRQLQEILFVYAWILRNPSIAGTTAKKIVFVGDSAGATLALGAILWATELNLRLPDGVFLVYLPAHIQTVPSPSRLLCLIDPLLPLGFTMQSLIAYAGNEDLKPKMTTAGQETIENDYQNATLTPEEISLLLGAQSVAEEQQALKVSCNPILSPFMVSDSLLKKFPPSSLVTVELDPYLDDSVEFAKRCRRLGRDIRLDILPGLPHGFLNFGLLSRDAMEGLKFCAERIRDLFERATGIC